MNASAAPPVPHPLPSPLRWIAVWRRNVLVWQKLLVPSLLSNFGEPLLYLLALGYGLGQFIDRMEGVPYLAFLASGLVCSSAMNTASFEGMYSGYTRMAVQRTWDAMLAAPLDISDVVVGEAMWGATKSLVNSSAVLIVALALGAVASPWAPLALPVVFLTGLCFASLALVITTLARSYDFFLYYTAVVVTPLLLLSGVFFPLDQMPAAIQWGAHCFPLAHAVALVRPLLLDGETSPWLWGHLLVLLGYTALALAVATTLARRRLAS
ncbi:MAG: ABC transporter permease [Candidatus Competibacterales bacterium]